MMMSQMSRLLSRTVLRRTATSTPVRHFRTSSSFRCKAEGKEEDVRVQDLRLDVKPTPFEKFVLVITRFYKRKEDIPERISFQTMKLSLDYFRGRATIAFCMLGFVLLYFSMLSGRRMRDSGDRFQYRGIKQREEWKEKGRLEREAAAKAAAEAEAAAGAKA